MILEYTLVNSCFKDGRTVSPKQAIETDVLEWTMGTIYVLSQKRIMIGFGLCMKNEL